MWEQWGKVLEAAKEGELKAIEHIIKKYEPLVRAKATKYFIRGYDYEDLVQEGNLTILKAIEKFDVKFKGNFTSYCDRALSNNFSYMLREVMKKEYEVSLESKCEELNLLDILTDGISTENLFFKNIQNKELAIILKALTDEDRELICFLYGDDKKTLSSWCKENNIEYFRERRRKDKILAKMKINLLNI
ncbi:MAG: sigma-70 family RNA polymerase sigma factor [Sarcina sp.]